MEGEGRCGVEMVSAALGRLCPWQMTSLKMRGVTESTHQMGVVWVEGGLLGVIEEEQRIRKGS